MEVHHHPHLPHGEKKKFKEYLLEFLMIFLAVTMGFIAENIREHISEHEKEKEYIESLMTELKSDTANLREIIDLNNEQVKGLDTLISFSRKDLHRPEILIDFYRLSRKYIGQYFVFMSNDAVMQQLKNSGNLRIIKKGHVADSLTVYYGLADEYQKQGENVIELLKDVSKMKEEIIDQTLFTDTAYFVNRKPTGKPMPPLRADADKMFAYFNRLVTYRAVTHLYGAGHLPDEMQSAEALLAFLKKEYGLNAG